MTSSPTPSSWDERYRAAPASFHPAPLVTEFAGALPPSRALELACGTGGNALWLAERGWQVTAVDFSPMGVGLLAAEAARRCVAITAVVADLERGEFTIAHEAWDLIVITKYFQLDLFEKIKRGVVSDGMAIASALFEPADNTSSPFRVRRSELRRFFSGWDVVAYREPAREDMGTHALAEIVAHKPA